ncbi:MAG: response regulator [Chthoniobacterales bacterium]
MTDQISNPELNQFRERLSEKLRTPLNAVVGFAELLALQPRGSHSSKDVQQILRAARELLEVIDRELISPAGTAAQPAATRRNNCDVLYIEDDAVNFMLVERILEYRPDLTLKHANNGQLGIESARAEQPKMILLDLNLPDIHGSEVLRVLQQDTATADIPIVVLSADATPTHIERLLTAGARNYLTKPFDIDPFLAVIDEFTAERACELVG